MKKILLLCSTAFVAPLAMVVAPAPAFAQQITTEINGQVTTANGAPIGNATVAVTDTRTGAVTTITTNGDGRFAARNLATGGPYTVTAVAQGYQGQTVEQVATTLQGATELTFALDSAATEEASNTVVVTAARARVTQLATGPGTSFGTEILENAPSFNRDIRDVIRIDPRVSLTRDDLSGQDRVSCLGGNDRGNAFTVDGIAQSDIYGLNETGFSARSSTPVPYDAVRETQVQFAPYDVEYGQFTGCAINVVTKSGSNRFHGSAFFEYTDQSLQGDRLNGRDIVTADFTDKRWGGSFGGPVIKDRLFFFGAYEKRTSADTQDAGPAGSGYSTEIPQVTEADFNAISDVLRSTYGIDPGPLGRSLPFTNERYFLRGDLQIVDGQRLEVTYQHLDEARVAPDDFFTGSSPQVVGLNTYLTSGSVSSFYSGRLYSNWTDNFSSELRYSHSETRDRQDPIGGGEAQSDNPIPRIIVGVTNGGQNGTVLAGPGTSRSANDLQSSVDQYKAVGKLNLGDHSLRFGAELNRAKVYNLFVQNATGTLVFRNINDLAAGLLSPGTGNNTTSTLPNNVVNGVTEGAIGNFTASGDINDAAARFSRSIYTLYAQDDWKIADNVNLVFGVRTDIFRGGHPGLNPNFEARYGFGNDTGFDDIDPIFLPRFAATWDVNDFSILTRTKLRAGLGVFSGGDPLVWFGNAFQNDGNTFGQGTSQAAGCPAGQIDVVTGGTFTGVPQCVIDAGAALASTGQANTQAVDPAIVMPTVIRANLGFETKLNIGSGFFDGWRLNADYIYSRYRNPFTIVDLTQAINPALGVNGFTIDGRPIYRQVDLSRAGCTGDLVNPGSPPVYQNVNAACFSTARSGEFLLTNAGGYHSQIASVLLSKDFKGGLLTPGGNVYVSLGYAYTDAHDRRNMYNSTANSNYTLTAAFDRQNPDESRGFYSTKHNVTLSTTFREKFIGDLATTFGVTFIARSGRPYSLTYTGTNQFNGNGGTNNALLYVPTGVDDPNLAPTSNRAAVISLVGFVNNLECASKYKGQTIPRNTCDNDSYYDVDLRLSQELPFFGKYIGLHDKVEVYAVVDNFLNVISSRANIFRRRNFSGLQDVATISGVDSAGRYIVTAFNGANFNTTNEIKNSSSLWHLKVGVSYKF